MLGVFKEYNFIDDNKFAEMYIKDKIDFQGRNKIRYSLIKKGIKESIIDERLCSIDDSVEEKAAFHMAKKKYFYIIKGENNINKVYNKLGNYMVGNGYDFPLVKRILKEILKEYNCIDKEDTAQEINRDEIYDAAKKRYDIIMKSENDRKDIQIRGISFKKRISMGKCKGYFKRINIELSKLNHL